MHKTKIKMGFIILYLTPRIFSNPPGYLWVGVHQSSTFKFSLSQSTFYLIYNALFKGGYSAAVYSLFVVVTGFVFGPSFVLWLFVALLV